MQKNILQSSLGKPTVLLSQGRWHVVHLANLVYIESQGHHKLFHFADRERPYTVEASMKTVEEVLATLGTFVTVHRSYIVNINYVCGYDSHLIYMIIRGKERTVPYSSKVVDEHFAHLFSVS